MKKTGIRFSSLLFFIVILGILLPTCPISAEAAGDSFPVTGSFSTDTALYSWEYLYLDDYFLSPAGSYQHGLARLTLGLALAAFRDDSHPDAQDSTLVDYLQKLGFSRIETEPYYSEPTADSICYGMAAKQIGDTTLMVCAVCGGNYKKEWASNLTVDNSVRSTGFQSAAMQVEDAIEDYLEKYSLSDNVKLWITGYSRGGAVANITAADCMESGYFDDIYAYTFATPRTTREPERYPNIFNIIQKEDIVPKVPLADWGYERYGTDLFLVSQETDMDCGDLMSRASEIYREITDSEMVFNSEINYELRTVVDYLLTLMPESNTYAKYLQPLVVDIMTKDEGTKDALYVLLEALQQYRTDDQEIGKELKALLDYVQTLINLYYLQGKTDTLPPRLWNQNSGVANLFNAHDPSEYLAILYASDDPLELYSDNTDYIRLMIYGKADVTISNGETILKEILADGTELVNGIEDPYSFPDADCSKEKVVITLPAGQSLKITVKSTALLPQTITYTGLRFSGNTVRAKADDVYSYLLKRGDTAEIHTAVKGRAIEPESSDYTDVSLFTEVIYSPTTVMRLENNSVVHLTISGLVNKILFILLVLLVQMVVSIVLTIIRKKKNKKRNPIVAFVWHGLIVVVFSILEVAMWYFIPILTLAKMIPGIIVYIAIVVYAIKGCKEESKNWKMCWILLLALAVFMILESLLIGDFSVVKGIFLIVVYTLFLNAVFFLLWKKTGQKGSETPDSECP